MRKIKSIIFTPFRISGAQMRPPVSLKSAHKVGVLNENWCKVSIVILTLLLLLYVYYTYCAFYQYKEYLSDDRKIWMMTFGGGGQQFYDAVDRCAAEMAQINVCDEIVKFTDADLKNDPDFWDKHHAFIENNKRGYGYWLWKPYLILKTLERMNENDILIHLDAGCEIVNNSDSTQKILEMSNDCYENNILYTSPGHNEKSYTKMDLFEYLDLKNEDVMNSNEYQATLIIIKKTEKMMDFVADWYNISCNYHLIDDSESILKNDPSFVDHRHTQSTFSLLMKTPKYKDVMINDTNIIKDCKPILLSRKRNG